MLSDKGWLLPNAMNKCVLTRAGFYLPNNSARRDSFLAMPLTRDSSDSYSTWTSHPFGARPSPTIKCLIVKRGELVSTRRRLPVMVRAWLEK